MQGGVYKTTKGSGNGDIIQTAYLQSESRQDIQPKAFVLIEYYC
jgi:hypothetical protein